MGPYLQCVEKFEEELVKTSQSQHPPTIIVSAKRRGCPVQQLHEQRPECRVIHFIDYFDSHVNNDVLDFIDVVIIVRFDISRSS